MVISSDDKAIDYIANNDKTIYTGAVGMKIAGPIVTNIFKVDPFFKPNFHCVQTALTNKLGPIKVNSATKSFVKSVHKHNQSICYWGVNTIEDMQKVIEIGADAITTDAPDKLYDLLNK
jgi:glycerophosphoryl diester phosphodiesterase